MDGRDRVEERTGAEQEAVHRGMHSGDKIKAGKKGKSNDERSNGEKLAGFISCMDEEEIPMTRKQSPFAPSKNATDEEKLSQSQGELDWTGQQEIRD
ncbi:hypothetical protein FRB91_005286 [Serendipita sp. 411]|nr:hypothetical protein FRC15_010568 [Serendipita sp. 397]KAG8833016.1 hypothetical protein FRC18_004281 [Serendipita sp. 400]KAG8853194.1 hypothetical protein FRB91_005286 [Serendipita sp. 411]KAG8871664.1 hypothetical protein FRC20_010286 [Serendipita sp. 405]